MCLVRVVVLCWIDHVWSSKECVCCACDPNERLSAPYVFVCQKLSPHLGVESWITGVCSPYVISLSDFAYYVFEQGPAVAVHLALWYVLLVCHQYDVCENSVGSVYVGGYGGLSKSRPTSPHDHSFLRVHVFQQFLVMGPVRHQL